MVEPYLFFLGLKLRNSLLVNGKSASALLSPARAL